MSIRRSAFGFVLLFAAMAAAFVKTAYAGEWTYDSSTNPKTISDGNWTIALLDSDLENGMVQRYESYDQVLQDMMGGEGE